MGWEQTRFSPGQCYRDETAEGSNARCEIEGVEEKEGGKSAQKVGPGQSIRNPSENNERSRSREKQGTPKSRVLG